MLNRTNQCNHDNIHYIDDDLTSSKNPCGCLNGETKVGVISTTDIEGSAKLKEKSSGYLNTAKKVLAVFGAVVSFILVAGFVAAIGFIGKHGMPFKVGCIGLGTLLGGIAVGGILEKAFARKHDSLPQQVNHYNSNEMPPDYSYDCG